MVWTLVCDIEYMIVCEPSTASTLLGSVDPIPPEITGWDGEPQDAASEVQSVQGTHQLGTTPAAAPGTGPLGTRRLSLGQSPAVTTIPIIPHLTSETLTYGTCHQAQGRPYSLFCFSNTVLPSSGTSALSEETAVGSHSPRLEFTLDLEKFACGGGSMSW